MFSIVIPTHNRAPILERFLKHLFQLDGIAECEVIVVDDGSTDNTATVLERFQQQAPTMLKVISLTNGGPARARNHGVRAATRDRILFIDDDVFPRQGMLQSQSRMLDQGYTGSQGLLLWHPEIVITPLIHYIDSRGSQFAFDRVEDPADLGFAYVYTGNFAVLRRAVLDVGGFEENFFDNPLMFAVFEDTILAYRLKQLGCKLALNQDAIADHLHDMTESHFFKREYKVGYSICRLIQKYPEIASALGLGRKNFMVKTQVQLLRLLNATPLIRNIAGYPINMRLRHREAFYCGFLQFIEESSRPVLSEVR